MNKLTQYLVEGILNEDKKEVVALYAGGFKPPTAGHFTVVEEALKQYPEIDKLIVLVGSGVRDGIEQAESILVWEIYQNYLPMKVEIQPSKKPPIGAVYSYAKNNPEDTVYWILGARDGKDEDLSDIATRTAAIDKKEDKYNNVEVKIITTSNAGMSGTNARKALQAGDEEAFSKFLPAQVEEKTEIFNILRPAVKETENPDDGKAAPFGSGYGKVNENASYSKDIDIKGKIDQLTQHMIDKGYNIEPLPALEFVDGDTENARDFFGKTAYYEPNTQTIVLYTEGRHPKDIVRSYAHEMIHHIQNLEGRLDNINTTNTQEDDYLNDIEAEANLKGTMTFRNWTDSLNENLNEIGDLSQAPYKWETFTKPEGSDDPYSYYDFSTDNGVKYQVVFNREEFGKTVNYDMTFVAKGKDGEKFSTDILTGGNEPLKIMSTIVDITRDQIKKAGDVEFITFEPTRGKTGEEGAKGNPRSKLYKVIIKKNFPKAKVSGTDTVVVDMTAYRNSDLNEVGDASQKPYSWTRKISKDDDLIEGVDYRFTTDLDTNYVAFFQMVGDGEFEFGFNIPGGNQAQVSNKGELFRVMATMVAVMEDFMNLLGNEWVKIVFSGSKDPSRFEDNRRDKLYMAYIKKNLPSSVKVGPDEDDPDMTALTNTLAEGFDKKLGKDPFGLNAYALELAKGLEETQTPDIQSQLRDKYSEVLEKLFLFPSKDGKYVELNLIKIKPEFKNQGWATKILDDLVDWAKQNNVTLTLTPSDTFGANEKRLEKFYKRFGFKPNKGKNRDFQTKDSMILTEGAYDALTTKLTKATINKWIEDSKKKPMPKKSFIDIDIDEVDGKGRDIEFNYVGLVEFDKKIDGYEVDGTSNSGEDKGKMPFVATLFKINPKVLPQAWSKISADVSDVIRHEIEHLTQAGDNVRGQQYDEKGNLVNKGKYMDDDIMIRDMINKAKVLPQSDYYKLEKEVDAMLQGLYLKAKKTKKPFKDVIKNYLSVAPGIETKEDREIILNLWRSRRGALSLPVFENKEEVMDYKIFLDMDGVLVNFDEQFKELTGEYPKDYEKTHTPDEFWGEIDGAGVGFWRGMKWMPGGEALYNRAAQFDHVLLSSPSRSETSKIGKRLWRRDKTPNTKLILARSYNKKKYAAANHILIDDREDNIQQWRDAGGIGILYKSAEQVNKELNKLGL